MKSAVFAASSLLLGLLASQSTLASGVAEPYVVFVVDVDVGGEVDGTSGGITPSLCSALERRPGLTVLCAPDVRQMLEAVSQLAAFGQDSPAGTKLIERVDGAHFLVRPYLRQTDEGLKLLLRLYHSEGTGGLVVPGKPAGRIVEVAKSGKVGDLLDQLDAASARTEKMLYEPRNDPGAKNEPPAPFGR